jgi:hypothetical protein
MGGDLMRAETLANLRAWMPRGSTVYLVLRHRSKSGMNREIGIVLFDGVHVIHPSSPVGEALGLRIGKRDGVLVKGCGMDMGFALVRRLAQVLYDETQALRHEWI